MFEESQLFLKEYLNDENISDWYEKFMIDFSIIEDSWSLWRNFEIIFVPCHSHDNLSMVFFRNTYEKFINISGTFLYIINKYLSWFLWRFFEVYLLFQKHWMFFWEPLGNYDDQKPDSWLDEGNFKIIKPYLSIIRTSWGLP